MSQSQVTIFVCVSCRQEGDSEMRPGAKLLDALRERLSAEAEKEIKVEPVECLAVCKRPCTIALGGEGKWTYVIGDLDMAADVEAVIASARGFAAAPNGIVAWKDRPDCFKKGVVSRAPPLGFALRAD